MSYGQKIDRVLTLMHRIVEIDNEIVPAEREMKETQQIVADWTPSARHDMLKILNQTDAILKELKEIRKKYSDELIILNT